MATQRAETRLPLGELDTAGRRPAVGRGRLLAIGTLTVLVSTIADVLVASALASWLQLPSVFTPLRTPSVASFTIVGVTGAVLVFALLTRLRPDPVPAFRLVAAVGLVISWVPDLLVWATQAFPGTTGPAVLSLMSLHVVAAGLSVLLLGRHGLTSGRRAK